MPKCPKPKDIEAATREHGGGDDWSFGPGMAETVADRIKYDVCAEFIIYKRENNLNQRELAQKLEISKALISKILRYQFAEFTIDSRLRYLEKLGIKYEFWRLA
ncbi:MAG: XRE family transcriptional regulator [Alphaproteobacteria bacterium]|nr:XRE family transcriptional regulator [Alphaproteobacteria bacterium]